MDFTELLFAAKIRKLAVKFRLDATPPDVHNAGGAVLMEWLEKNPISNFVPIALEKIQETSEQINQLLHTK